MSFFVMNVTVNVVVVFLVVLVDFCNRYTVVVTLHILIPRGVGRGTQVHIG